jgi:hypothetical protein
LRKSGTPREDERLLSHGPLTADFSRCARRHGSAVCSDHNVWIKHREKRLKVSTARGGEEGIDHLSLAGEICVGNHVRSVHPTTSAARELPYRSWSPSYDGSDLVEGYGKYVKQYKREPLGGGQSIEYYEKRETD